MTDQKLPDPQNPSPGEIPFSEPWGVTPLGWVRHRLAESVVHSKRLLQPLSGSRCVILPSRDPNCPTSFLRAWSVGQTLRRDFGWRVTTIPYRLELVQRQRIIRMEKPDVILMGLERHPLNRPRYYSGTPIVFDLDDADYLWPYARDFVIECCRGSQAVTAGSHAVADWCRQYNDDVSVIWTGSPLPQHRGDTPSSQRDRIIAWGHSRPYDYREEGEHLCRILCALARQTSFQFWIYGVRDQAEMAYLLDPLRAEGVPVRTFRMMPYEDFLRSMDQVAIGIHIISPENQYSHGKSFGKVLGYLASRVAVVASDAIDHRLFFEHKKNGMLADTDEEWVSSLHWLLDHPEERDAMVAQASVDFENRLSTRATAARYDAVFRRVIERTRGDLTTW